MLRTVKKDLILSCASALLFILSFSPYNMRFLAWAAFVPLFAAIENKSRMQAFFLSYISGIVFWLGTVYWLVHVTAAGMIVLILYLALYWGIFGLLVSWNKPRRNAAGIFYVPALWVLGEYARSHALTGFPWALAAYTQSKAHALIQISDVTGAWGVSFVILMVNAVLYTVWSCRPHAAGSKKLPVVVACCIFIGVYTYGAVRLHGFSRSCAEEKSIKVAVIQGNIPQELKWQAHAREYIMRTYEDLSGQASDESPDLIVWPEAAVPAAVSEGSAYEQGLQRLAESLQTSLLTGAVTYREGGYYNSAVLFRPGAAPDRYDKMHLVPFGEYVPLSKIFGFLQTIVPIGEVQRGTEYRVFGQFPAGGTTAVAFSSLICYEDMFPGLSRAMVRRGAEFLVTVTNDAWYQRTAAPYQHFQAAVFRAVENRVWMVRSANTGVSGFVRPDGMIEGLVEDAAGAVIFVPGYLARSMKIPPRSATIYTRFGDWFITAVFLGEVLCALGARLPRDVRRHR
ncbi:MAG: apolipoprotein N-acyltransferase [Candidatus Omnitrophica bacterium]|nr:apolipoprotein N-acyltransferase [Candidatus Omnitrophota bacterium]